MISERAGRRQRRFVCWQDLSFLILLGLAANGLLTPTPASASSAPDPVLVVSDVDDTIKDTHVTLLDSRLRNPAIIFDGVHSWRPVPGMAQLYQHWKTTRRAHFHYVSAGPVRYERRLKESLASWGFPDGLVTLRSGGGLVASRDYKIHVLAPILEADRRQLIVFVGDSGERDPESYGELARRFPRQVLGILIRQVTAEDRSSPRYQKAFNGLPADQWTLFRQPGEIATLPLRPLKDRQR